ncbi:hypothetical protein GIB67_026354 [Kingdonia uniflora]|uniref:Uncharacterized protein n=1 Tax=Kingdonia uniflora TaxID=39325 RepID=A0A7J7P5Y9_9MAGN|nr:hypothetical protein GIB67_026354 [Kingdonia uniflora]
MIGKVLICGRTRHNDFFKRYKTARKRKLGHVRVANKEEFMPWLKKKAEFTKSDDMEFHDIMRGQLAFVTRFMDSNTTTGNDILGNVGRAKKKRGTSQGPASLPDGQKRNVSVNHLGQQNGVDEDMIAFVTNVGVLARTDIPIIYDDIQLVPGYFTNRILEKLEEGHEMSLVSDDYLKKKITSSWRLNKSRLQTKYNIGHGPTDVKARPTPPLVPDDDWHMFVNICNSAKHIASNARNKVNRSKLKAPICVGRRSLPVIRHMLAMKRKLNSDALVARSEVYLTAHAKRDNTVQYPELAEKIMAIERLEPHLKFASVDDSLAKETSQIRSSSSSEPSVGPCQHPSPVLHRHLNKKYTLNSQKDRGVPRGEVVVVDPYTLIHNVLLGDGFYKILLSKVMKPRTPLSKDDGYSKDLGDDREGAYVIWAIWKLVMLYLKEEGEKKIGDFERQVRTPALITRIGTEIGSLVEGTGLGPATLSKSWILDDVIHAENIVMSSMAKEEGNTLYIIVLEGQAWQLPEYLQYALNPSTFDGEEWSLI